MCGSHARKAQAMGSTSQRTYFAWCKQTNLQVLDCHNSWVEYPQSQKAQEGAT